MLSYTTTRSARARVLGAVAAACVGAAAFLGACANTDELLSVTDPDIVNPSDVQSPAGANAVRLGALARLNAATTGVESYPLLGGLLADEWRSGDSFIDRDQIDQREVERRNSFLLTANRNTHRARMGAIQAVGLLKEFAVTAPGWQSAEMYFVQAYVENMLAENHCSGIVFGSLEGTDVVNGAPITTTATLEMALAHADSGLRLITGTTADDNRVRNALAVTKGRILMNLNRYADAATAVAAVPTSFRYNTAHSTTTNENQIWSLNNSNRRYTVNTGLEGPAGLNFAGANDPRVPTCAGGSALCIQNGVTQPRTFDNTTLVPMHAQLLWATRDASVAIVSGVEARLIEAEAQLKAGNATASLATLNALRAATGTGSGGVTGLTPLTDASTDAARVDQLFRERAFWLFGRGTRLGEMRRLIRQYGRAVNAVFPTGAFHKGGNYGADVNFPIPLAEDNNPNAAGGCIDRTA